MCAERPDIALSQRQDSDRAAFSGDNEARMFRALISVEREAELFDAAQALKLERVNETNHQRAFFGVCPQADDVVYGVAVDALVQRFNYPCHLF